MQSAPPMKNRIAEARFRNVPQITETTMNTRETRIIKIPTPTEAFDLQKKEAIMLTSGPPNKMIGAHEVSMVPSDISEMMLEQIDAQRVLGNERTNAITPRTIGAAVFGFLTTISWFSLMIVLLYSIALFLLILDSNAKTKEKRLPPVSPDRLRGNGLL